MEDSEGVLPSSKGISKGMILRVDPERRSPSPAFETLRYLAKPTWNMGWLSGPVKSIWLQILCTTR